MDEHAAAIQARLEANPKLLKVYYGARKPTEDVRVPPYVVFYLHIPDEHPTKLNRTTTDETWRTIFTHSCGDGHDAADIVRKHVRTQLLDHVLTVAGWRNYRISHESGDQPDWSNTTGVLLVDAADQWDYRCKPA